MELRHCGMESTVLWDESRHGGTDMWEDRKEAGEKLLNRQCFL